MDAGRDYVGLCWGQIQAGGPYRAIQAEIEGARNDRFRRRNRHEWPADSCAYRPADRTGVVHRPRPDPDRQSVVEGKSVSVRVDLGGRRIIKKKTDADIKTKTKKN